MSQGQESPNHTYDETLQACIEETKILEETQLLVASEEVLSSSSLICGTVEEAPAAEIPTTLMGPESPCFSSTALTATSLSKSDEGVRIQEEQEGSSTLKSMPGNDDLLKDPLEEKAALLVQFLLMKYRMKEAITKEEMLKMVIKKQEDNFPEILSMASERMELVFGIDVIEVDPTSHSYALLNKLGLTYNGLVSGDEGVPKTSLMIFVLCVIFMKGGRATEVEVWDMLNRLDIYAGQNHFLYGEPMKFITHDLVLEKYMEYGRVPNSKPARYEYRWGSRAHAEINKVKLLEFWARINDSDCPIYSSLYEEALRNEKKRVRILPRAGSTLRVKLCCPTEGKPKGDSHP